MTAADAGSVVMVVVPLSEAPNWEWARFEARCSCGWVSRAAVQTSVRYDARQHSISVHGIPCGTCPDPTGVCAGSFGPVCSHWDDWPRP